MARIEKTVFISYRRKDLPWALLIYKYLTANGFDVFFDFTSLSGGKFGPIILGNIKARAHFLAILTPTALDRCKEPGDWLRQEIETAIDENRNIIPLCFDGFDFANPVIADKLSGKLETLKEYNGLEVPARFFDAAMKKMRDQFLNVALDTELHPVSDDVQKVVESQQKSANEALLPKPIETKPPRKRKIKEIIRSVFRFSWIALPIIVIPILFHLITGRSVLFTKWLLSETVLPPQENIYQVFDMETGELFNDESPLLQISSIRYEYANGFQESFETITSSRQEMENLPVEWGEEGWKIRLEYLFDEDKLQEEDAKTVPSRIQLVVNHLQPSDNLILVYILTDEVYFQPPTLQIFPFRRTKIYRDLYIGQNGILNFIDLNDYSVTLSNSPNIVSPGVGPITAIFVVEFEDNEPKLRSNLVFVKRKGIMHPSDIWFTQDSKREPFITVLLNEERDRMFAFQSPESDFDVNDIFVSRLDGSGITNIAPTFFRGSDEVICGWGEDDENHNTLYFLSSKEGGNAKTPYKVIYSNETISQPLRLSNFPQRCTHLQ